MSKAHASALSSWESSATSGRLGTIKPTRALIGTEVNNVWHWVKESCLGTKMRVHVRFRRPLHTFFVMFCAQIFFVVLASLRMILLGLGRLVLRR